MDHNKEKAKKIFFEYACNHFYMDHDGVDKAYDEFGVTKAEEAEWRREYVSFWVGQLSIDDLTAVDKLSDAWAVEALPALIEMADKGDSYAKLWYANSLWRLASASRVSVTIQEQAIKTATNLWKSIVQEPIRLSESHKAKLSSLKLLDKSTPEEYVLNYAKRNLAGRSNKGEVTGSE